jgi:S-DNA-T family DNA segregation ATPase FtsK/SpoIIIE
MPTEDDMRTLGLDAKATRGAKLPPGRGFTQESEEFQIAVPVGDGAPLAVSQAIDGPGAGSAAVREIEILPGSLARASLGRAESVAGLPLGLGDEELGPVEIDLGEMHFLISGPYRSGRSTALRTIAEGLRAAAPEARLLLLAPRRSPLRELDLWDETEVSAEGCAEAIGGLLRDIEADEGEERVSYVLIDDGGELSEARTVIELERLVRLGRDGGPRVIAAVESAAARGIGIGWVRELRREGHGLLLQPDLAADGDLLGAQLPRRLSMPLVPGRGFLVRAGVAELIQVGS